jgi:hypothetical protein
MPCWRSLGTVLGLLALTGCFPSAADLHRQSTDELCEQAFIRPTNNAVGGVTYASNLRAELNL